jgi:hypothetical protein
LAPEKWHHEIDQYGKNGTGKMALSTFIILDIHKYTFNILNKVKEHTSNYFKSSCMCSVRNSVIAKANVSPSTSATQRFCNQSWRSRGNLSCLVI